MLNILDRRLHELYFLIQLQQKLGQTLSGSGINYYHSFYYVFVDLLQYLISLVYGVVICLCLLLCSTYTQMQH